MAYSSILKRLLDNVPGAIGAGFVDHDGEAIDLAGDLEDFLHRIHLAYQGIFLRDLMQIHNHDEESLSHVTYVHQNLTTVVKPLKNGFHLVLTLEHRKRYSRALRQLDQAALEINQVF